MWWYELRTESAIVVRDKQPQQVEKHIHDSAIASVTTSAAVDASTPSGPRRALTKTSRTVSSPTYPTPDAQMQANFPMHERRHHGDEKPGGASPRRHRPGACNAHRRSHGNHQLPAPRTSRLRLEKPVRRPRMMTPYTPPPEEGGVISSTSGRAQGSSGWQRRLVSLTEASSARPESIWCRRCRTVSVLHRRRGQLLPTPSR
jgi:hypothetical protein